jgi:hypothetical protein
MNIAEIKRRLAAVNPGYTARYVPAADETVDAEIKVVLHGTDTRWATQVGDRGDFFINEYGFNERGDLDSCTEHGMFPNLKQAVLGLCSLLEQQP